MFLGSTFILDGVTFSVFSLRLGVCRFAVCTVCKGTQDGINGCVCCLLLFICHSTVVSNEWRICIRYDGSVFAHQITAAFEDSAAARVCIMKPDYYINQLSLGLYQVFCHQEPGSPLSSEYHHVLQRQ